VLAHLPIQSAKTIANAIYGYDLEGDFWKLKTSQIIFFQLFDSSQVFSTFAARF
jgi:hypothetical protein